MIRRKGVKLIKSNGIYSGKISLRKDKFLLNGKIIEKEIVEHQDSIGVVPVIGSGKGSRDRSDVILVMQYRRAADKILLEIPAGKIEEGETPEMAAIREMSEETGYVGNLKPLLSWYLAPGYSSEYMHVFIASDLRKAYKRGVLDDDENIVLKRIKLSSALKKCFCGEIQDCKTVAALLAYHYYYYCRNHRHSHSQSD